MTTIERLQMLYDAARQTGVVECSKHDIHTPLESAFEEYMAAALESALKEPTRNEGIRELKTLYEMQRQVDARKAGDSIARVFNEQIKEALNENAAEGDADLFAEEIGAMYSVFKEVNPAPDPFTEIMRFVSILRNVFSDLLGLLLREPKARDELSDFCSYFTTAVDPLLMCEEKRNGRTPRQIWETLFLSGLYYGFANAMQDALHRDNSEQPRCWIRLPAA